MTEIFDPRSALFLPASNPRAVAKARTVGADLVILDLEDSVKAEEKAAARNAAIEALAEPWSVPVAIRVNGTRSPWHRDDIAALAATPARFVVVPRVQSADEAAAVGRAVAKPVLSMIETAAGVLAAPEIARVSAGLIAGTNDLRADLRLPMSADRSSISTALQWIVLSARAAGILAIDGVFNGLEDEDGFRKEAEDGRALGFDAKSLIHPNQIAPCHQIFSPGAEEIARAAALVAAYGGGAERFEDEMIEQMHVDAAKRILERARH